MENAKFEVFERIEMSECGFEGVEGFAKVSEGEATYGKSEDSSRGEDEASVEIGMNTPVWFGSWKLVLENSDLPEGRKRSFEIAINWYLSYCKRARSRVTKESANAFVETVRRERLPTKLMLEGWINALRWFFREAERDARTVVGEIPSELVEAEHKVEGGELWMDVFLGELRRRHYSYRTEVSYLHWVRAYAAFLGSNDLASFGRRDVRRFLDYLAVTRRVGASTQRQALNAVVFLYKRAFRKELGDFSDYLRSRPKTNLPTVLSVGEVRRLMDKMTGRRRLMAKLQYGTGLRVSELAGLRVKDLDFEREKVLVIGGKGNKDRSVVMPRSIRGELERHLEEVKEVFQSDRTAGLAGVYLPEALERKFTKAGKEWPWFWVWPSREVGVDPRSGIERRHHVQPRSYQGAVSRAASRAEIPKRVTTHTLRHSFATHMLDSGSDLRTLQDLMGHKDIKTTQVYLHLVAKREDAVVSPLDLMDGLGEEG